MHISSQGQPGHWQIESVKGHTIKNKRLYPCPGYRSHVSGLFTKIITLLGHVNMRMTYCSWPRGFPILACSTAVQRMVRKDSTFNWCWEPAKPLDNFCECIQFVYNFNLPRCSHGEWPQVRLVYVFCQFGCVYKARLCGRFHGRQVYRAAGPIVCTAGSGGAAGPCFRGAI